MDDVDNLIIPEDLLIALNEHKPANQYFEAFSPSNKRFILRYIYWLKVPKQGKNQFYKLRL